MPINVQTTPETEVSIKQASFNIFPETAIRYLNKYTDQFPGKLCWFLVKNALVIQRHYLIIPVTADGIAVFLRCRNHAEHMITLIITFINR